MFTLNITRKFHEKNYLTLRDNSNFDIVAGYGENKYHRYVAIKTEDRSKIEER